MSEETWLYLYENRVHKRLYVGIADSLDRVWQEHNSDAEKLRDMFGTQILQTVQPFSSRDDALKAEGIAIHIAMLAGVQVLHARDEMSVADAEIQITNRAGTISASALGPAVKRRDGTIDFKSLVGTAIVTIKAEDMDDRRGPYGGLEGAVFSKRAQKWWMIAESKQPKIKRLLAILSGSHGVILGDWDIESGAGFGPNGDIFPLADPELDDPRGVKGMRLIGVSGQASRIYSLDLRA